MFAFSVCRGYNVAVPYVKKKCRDNPLLCRASLALVSSLVLFAVSSSILARGFRACDGEQGTLWGAVLISFLGPFVASVAVGAQLMWAKMDRRRPTHCSNCSTWLDVYTSTQVYTLLDGKLQRTSLDDFLEPQKLELESADRRDSWYSSAKQFSSICAGSLAVQTILTSTFNGLLVDEIKAPQVIVLLSVGYFGILRAWTSVQDVYYHLIRDGISSCREQIRQLAGHHNSIFDERFAYGLESFDQRIERKRFTDDD